MNLEDLCDFDRPVVSESRFREALADASGEERLVLRTQPGELLLALGRTDEGGPHFASAHALLSADAWLAESEPDRLARLRDLAG